MALTGGPPVRGTKLSAWKLPTMWKTLENKGFTVLEDSQVLSRQEEMRQKTFEVLEEMAKDVSQGLLETVGVKSEFSLAEGKSSMILHLPKETDVKTVAEAIALENADAWLDSQGRVHLGINPWFSTKDVDQTVLCAIKVIHVLLGFHAVCEVKPQTFMQKVLSSFTEIIQLEKQLKQSD